MARECGWCRHPDRRELEARVLAGEPLPTVAEAAGYSTSAARRHMTNHVRPGVLAAIEPSGDPAAHPGTFAARLLELADESAAVRTLAHEQNDPNLLLRAGREERDTLTVLLGRLGITSAGTVTVLRESRALALAVRDVLLDVDPDVSRRLASRLVELGEPGLAGFFDGLSRTESHDLQGAAA